VLVIGLGTSSLGSAMPGRRLVGSGASNPCGLAAAATFGSTDGCQQAVDSDLLCLGAPLQRGHLFSGQLGTGDEYYPVIADAQLAAHVDLVGLIQQRSSSGADGARTFLESGTDRGGVLREGTRLVRSSLEHRGSRAMGVPGPVPGVAHGPDVGTERRHRCVDGRATVGDRVASEVQRVGVPAFQPRP